jgi:hypothetical protein
MWSLTLNSLQIAHSSWEAESHSDVKNFPVFHRASICIAFNCGRLDYYTVNSWSLEVNWCSHFSSEMEEQTLGSLAIKPSNSKHYFCLKNPSFCVVRSQYNSLHIPTPYFFKPRQKLIGSTATWRLVYLLNKTHAHLNSLRHLYSPLVLFCLM